VSSDTKNAESMGDFQADSSPIPCGLRLGFCGVALIYVYYTPPIHNSMHF